MIAQTRIDSKCTSKIYRDICLLFFFSLVFCLMFIYKTPINGDTYLYARSISTFDGPIIHFGYYILCSIVHIFLKQFAITPIEALGYISALLGSMSAVCMYLFTLELTENRLQSFLAAIFLMFSGTVWHFSLHGEVYVPQLFFVLLSVLFILKMRPLLSSLSILIAISITPTSFISIPPLIYLMYLKQFEKKQLIYFGFPIFLAIIFLIVLENSKLLDILANAVYSPRLFFVDFSYKKLVQELVYRVIKVYGKSFNLASIFAIFGFVILYKKDKKEWFLMIAFLLPFSLYLLNIGLFSGDHLIISFIAISFLGSYGLIQLFNITNAPLKLKSFTSIVLTIVYMGISSLLFISPEIRDMREFNRVINNLRNEYKDNAIMISDYNFGMAFSYLTKEQNDYFLFTGRPNKLLRQHTGNLKESQQKLEASFWINLNHLPDFISGVKNVNQLLNGRVIYYVDRLDWPTRIIRILLTDKALEKRKNKIKKSKRLKTYWEKKFGQKIQFLRIIDSPLHPVYLLQKTSKEEL